MYEPKEMRIGSPEHRMFRSIEQTMLALKPELSPEVWKGLLELLMQIATALINIFHPPAPAGETNSPPEHSGGEREDGGEADEGEGDTPG